MAWAPQITPYERLHEMLVALIAHEARRVWVLNREASHHSFFAKSVQRGVELPELIEPECLEVAA